MHEKGRMVPSPYPKRQEAPGNSGGIYIYHHVYIYRLCLWLQHLNSLLARYHRNPNRVAPQVPLGLPSSPQAPPRAPHSTMRREPPLLPVAWFQPIVPEMLVELMLNKTWRSIWQSTILGRWFTKIECHGQIGIVFVEIEDGDGNGLEWGQSQPSSLIKM